jgi:hypothetical protein
MRRRLRAEEIVLALNTSGGFISTAAEKLGATYHTVWTRIHRTPVLRQALDDVIERYIDLAESKLLAAIGKGEGWAICFFLKCKGKHRGYVERQEHTGSDGGEIVLRWVDDKRPISGD